MSSQIQEVKEKLSSAIVQLYETSWMFVKDPVRNFTRERKLTLREVISVLLAMEGGSLTGEWLRYFGCSQHNRNRYRFIPYGNAFDFLPRENHKHDPVVFYSLPFRIVRFRLTDSVYETVVTNLNTAEFPPDELKRLYSMRWGIETSFRELKYTVGLLHFHANYLSCPFHRKSASLVGCTHSLWDYLCKQCC